MSDIFINIPGQGSVTWKSPVEDAADLPLTGNIDGDVRVTLDTNSIYIWDQNTTSWKLAASPGGAVAINALLGDVSAVGPGAVPATVNFVGGISAADVASGATAGNNATSSNTPNTIVKRDGSGNFVAGTITANLLGSSTTFTGPLSGDVTGTQSATSISSTTVTAKLLTGYSVGSNTPLSATDSILSAFGKVQGQLNATTGAAITALTGDATATGPGSVPITLATVNGNVGSFGSSTSIPNFTVNAKGLITAAVSNVVIAPAGTLTGTTLASNIVSSSLTSVGTISTGVWNGSVINSQFGGTGVNNSFNLTIAGTSSINGTFSGSSSGSNTGDVTIGTANGLSLIGQVLSLGLSSTSTTGSLSSTDWNTFNNKQSTITIGVLDAQAANANGLALVSNVLSAQSADATHPGLVNNTTQTFSGNKTFTGTISASNLSGTNTGDVTLAAFGSSPNSNGASLSGQILTLQPADGTNPGGVSILTQTFAGDKTFTGTVAVTSTSLTALTVNTTSLVVDATNGALGVNTIPATTAVLDIVNNSGATKAIQVTGYGSNVGFRGRRANGTLSSPTQSLTGDVLTFFSGRGYGTSGFAAASTGVVNITAAENFTNTSMATYIAISTTPTGSITSAERMRINSTGNILIGTTTDNAKNKLQLNGSYVSSTVALTDAANIATDASLANRFTVTLAGNRNLSAPTNPTDGQKVIWMFTQDGTGGRTLTFDAIFDFGNMPTLILSSAAGKRDMIGAIYSSTNTKWDVVAYSSSF